MKGFQLFVVIILFKKSFEKKRKKIGEGVDFSIKTDAFVGELYAVFNIGILFFFYECLKRGSGRVVGFHLDRDEGSSITKHKVNF